MSKVNLNKKDVLLTLISIIIGVGISSLFWYLEKKPKAAFNVLSNTNVFSVNTEGINDLQVSYGNENLSQSNKKLILLTVRFSNEGSAVLGEDQYFSKTPLGIKILNGKIAERPELINASTNNLRNFTSITTKGNDSILIDKPPLAKEDYLTFKVLTITDKNKEEINIQAIGSINGTDPILVRESYRKGQDQQIRIWDKILIALGYVFLALVIAISLFSLFQPKDLNIEMGLEQRKKIAESYINRYSPVDEVTEKILQFYVNYGLYPLKNYNLHESFEHYYFNEFPYGSESPEIFNAMKEYILFLKSKGFISVDEEKRTLEVKEEVKIKGFGVLEIVGEFHDRMHRGFAY